MAPFDRGLAHAIIPDGMGDSTANGLLAGLDGGLRGLPRRCTRGGHRLCWLTATRPPQVGAGSVRVPWSLSRRISVRTFSPKPTDVQRVWYEVDADGAVLGRLAAEVARLLRGKH